MRALFKSTLLNPIEGFFFLSIITVSAFLLTTPYYFAALFLGPLILFLFLLGYAPQIGYFIILFLIPFDAFTGLSGTYQGLSIAKVTGFWVTVVLLFYFLVDKKNSFNLKSDMWPWFLVFFIVNLLSALISDFKSTSYSNLAMLLIAYTFFTMTLLFVTQKNFIKTVPTIIVVSIGICSLISLAGYYFEIPGLIFARHGVKRATGAASDPNIFSLSIVFSLPILAHMFFSSRRLFIKLMVATLFIIDMVAVILTSSRGGGLGLGVILVCIVLYNIRRLKPKYVGFLGIFLALTVLMAPKILPESYIERLQSTTDTTDQSISTRSALLQFGLGTFANYPILGSGPGTFRDQFAASEIAFQTIYSSTHEGYRGFAHNSYIEVLAGTGLLGIISFFLIVFISFRSFYIAGKRFEHNGDEDMHSLVRSYMMSFLAVLLFIMILSVFYHKYLWISIALSQVALRLSNESGININDDESGLVKQT